MGIKNLTKVIKKEAPDAINKIEFKELANKIIAIDTSIFLYKFSYFQPNFIKLFWFQVKRFVENGIIPVYVFDGAPPKAKDDTISDRKEKKEQLEEKIDELKSSLEEMTKTREKLKKEFEKTKDNELIAKIDNIDKTIAENRIEIKSKEKTNIRITSKKVRYLKKLFDEMCVPYVKSITEAEKVAAYLCKKGIVSGVMSDDTDLLPQGVKNVYRDYSVNNYYLTEVKLDNVLNGMDMTYEQFVDFCILCGCDYTGTIPKVGPITAFSLLKKCNNIEGCLKERNMECPVNFKYEDARKLFMDDTEIEESEKMMSRIEKLKDSLENEIKTDIDITKWYNGFPE
jgi:flap endonuclease-1